MATTWGRRRLRASWSPSRLDVIIGWKSWAAATSATSLRKRSTPSAPSRSATFSMR